MKKQYTIVKNAADLAALEAHIDESFCLAFDTETTGLNVRKDKVIGLSVSGKVGTAFYLPLLSWNKTFHCLQPVFVNRDEFTRILLKIAQKELLMWNGSYDCQIVKNDFGINLIPSLLADIMLMKHTVEEDGEFKLKETAVELGEKIGLGFDENPANEEQVALKANVLANGGTWTEANKEMFKADLEIMGPYACADADITLRCAEYYRQILEREGLEEFFYDKEVMPLYKCVTIKMEAKGVHLDLPKIHATRAALIEDMAHLEAKILRQLDSLAEVQEWKKQRAKEEFPPKMTGSYAQAVAEFYKIPLPKTAAGKYSLAAKEVSKLPDSDAKDFLLGNQTYLENMDEISWKLFCDKGMDKINILSKQQMGQIVFDALGISPLSKTAKGAPQFNETMIEHLDEVEKLPWARDLNNYNKLSKILGTYIDRFLEEQEDGIFYPSFFQHRTISGRFGADIQQLPRPKEESELDEIVLKYNNVIREFFISAPGRVFIDSDYESLEPHVFAHVSNDDGLRDIFRKGHDFYSTIAIATEKMVGVSADKKAENYLGKVNKPARQKSKAYSLGVPYGLTAFALGKTLGISTEEAQKLIDGYLDGFPNLKQWMEESRYQAKHYGFVKSEAGRVRHLPKVKELYKKHGDQLLNFKYRKKLVSQLTPRMGYAEADAYVTSLYRDYKNGLNNSCNYQIQSLAASIVNAASIAITREFEERGIDGWIAANIHDQIIVDVPEDRLDEAKEIVERCMKCTTKLSLELKAPPAVAHNWKDGH